MDLKQIIAQSTRYNFHSHTPYCDGRDSMAAIAAAATECGMLHLGFSPHSPITVDSPCNMKAADVPDYMAEVHRLDALLPINIYAGMEIDYLSPSEGPASPFYQDLGLDYAIGSVHFVKSRRGQYVDIDGSFERFSRNMAGAFDSDLRYVVESFYDSSTEMLEQGCFDILGHFDKVIANAALYAPGLEQEGWYRDTVTAFIDRVIASDVIVEINTKARLRPAGRFFPDTEWWPRLVEAGVVLAVNSDVHEAALIDASRSEAFDILSSLS